MTIDSVLEAHGLAKTFRTGFFRKKVQAVRSVSLSVQPGEIFGLVGPNGAGKSTTIKMLLGLVSPDRGEIRIFGKPADDVSLRSRLGYLPEKPTLYEHLNVVELLDFYGGLFGMSRRDRRERGKELIGLVGLSDARGRPISKFSKGMKQRAGIAQALLNDPDLVILDEPQSGLDPIGRREIRDLILELRKSGKTILFCSHILPDVQDICDRVAVMNQGRVKDVGFLHELVSSEVLYYELYVRDWRDDHQRVFDEVDAEITPVGEMTRLELAGDVDVDAVVSRLSAEGVHVESLQPHKESLEDVFVRGATDPGDAEAAA